MARFGYVTQKFVKSLINRSRFVYSDDVGVSKAEFPETPSLRFLYSDYVGVSKAEFPDTRSLRFVYSDYVGVSKAEFPETPSRLAL